MRWLFWWRPPCLLRQVLVTLKHDDTTAYRAVLWSSRGAWLTFRSCSLLTKSLPPTPMDGDLVIHRSNVAFLQVVG